MPDPGITEYTLDIVNTMVGLAYIQDQTHFAAPRAFDIIPTTARMGQYIAWERGAFMRDKAERRGDSQESSGSGYDFSRLPYFCEVYAHHKDIGHITRGMAENFLQAMPMAAAAVLTPEAMSAVFIARVLLLRWEKLTMERYFVPGVWGTDMDSAAADFVPWNAGTNATIQANILAAKRTVLLATGYEPNALLMSYDAFQACSLDPKIQQRFQYTTPDSLTEAMLARYLQVEQLYVAKAVEAISDEGQTIETAFIPGDRALLYYRPDAPGPMQAASAYTFAWTGISAGLNETMGVASFYIPQYKTTRVEGEVAIDPRVVGPDLAVFFDKVAPQD